jgi:hypothetical protein
MKGRQLGIGAMHGRGHREENGRDNHRMLGRVISNQILGEKFNADQSQC